MDIPRDVDNAALGALWGAAVGNATGTMLVSFRRSSMEDVDMALAWESNRSSRRAPGQVKQYKSFEQCIHNVLAAPACFARYTHWMGSCMLQ